MRAGPASTLLLVAAITVGPAAAEDSGPLPVFPGAEQVTAQTTQDGVSVEFDVREPYPALKTIDYLVKTLGERGWKIALPGTFRSPEPDPGRVPVAERHRGRHVWEGRWVDASGNETTYRLVYDCPQEQNGMHSVYVHVSGLRYGKVEAEKREAERQRALEAERRRKHEAFCADLRARKLPSAGLFCEE
jgi:hypothetical protein